MNAFTCLCRDAPRRFVAAQIVDRAAPSRRDPTGTADIRARFRGDLDKRWAKLRALTLEAFATGIVGPATAASIHSSMQMARHYGAGGDPVRDFQAWFDEALRQIVVGDGAWLRRYIEDAIGRARVRAGKLVARDGLHIVDALPTDRTQALTSLATAELQGVCEAVSQQAVRCVAHMLLAQQGAPKVSRGVSDVISAVGKARSRQMADYMVVKAFNGATLDAYRAAGIGKVGIVPERLRIKRTAHGKTLRDYDPDEPRDPRGRWESGWFHGTRTAFFNEKGKEPIYITTNKRQAWGYAHGVHLGGKGKDLPHVKEFALKPGKVLDINEHISKAFEEGEDADVGIEKGRQEALKTGARYLEYDHPNSGEEGEHRVRISLFPHEDIKHVGTSFRQKKSDNLADYDPDEPRDPAGKWTSGAGGAIRDRVGAFVSGPGKQAIRTVAHKLSENKREILAGAITFSLYHLAGADFPPDVEEQIHDQVVHFAENAQVSVAIARGYMSRAVDEMIALRRRFSRDAMDAKDDVLEALLRLKAILAKDELFKDGVDIADKVFGWTPTASPKASNIFERPSREPPTPEEQEAIEESEAKLQALEVVEVLNAEDPCPICEEISADGPYDIDEAEGLIPAHPNCLPGDTLVLARDGISATSERRYAGQLVIIHTASGRFLSCTPNHPILTRDGWQSAHLLHVGDNVISDSGSEWEQAVLLDNHDGKNVPVAIHEIARSFLELGEVMTIEVPTTGPDFHGDGMHGEIAIIRSDGKLRLNFLATRTDHLGKFSLVWRNSVGPILVCLRRLGTLLAGCYSASRCFMGGFDLAFPLSGCHLLPFECFRCAGVAPFNVVFRKDAGDDIAADPSGVEDRLFGHSRTVVRNDLRGIDSKNVRLGSVFRAEHPLNRLPAEAKLADELRDGKAGPVFLDEIVSIDVRDFIGHVYNLQTPSGHYSAGGIITHNCRCAFVPANDARFADPERLDE